MQALLIAAAGLSLGLATTASASDAHGHTAGGPVIPASVLSAVAAELRAIVGDDNVSTDEADNAEYGADKFSFHTGPGYVCVQDGCGSCEAVVTPVLVRSTVIHGRVVPLWLRFPPGLFLVTVTTSPNVVVFPTSTEQVSEVVKVCHKHKIPVRHASGPVVCRVACCVTHPG